MQRWKIVAVAAVVAAIVVGSLVVLLVATTRESARPAETPAVQTPGPRVSRPPGDPGPTPTPMQEDRPANAEQAAQVKVCDAYLDAFLTPGSEAERAARLREWGTPQNVEQAKRADRLPDARRAGDCTLDPENARPNQVQAYARLTDGTWWSLTLVKDPTVDAQWRVHSVTREGH